MLATYMVQARLARDRVALIQILGLRKQHYVVVFVRDEVALRKHQGIEASLKNGLGDDTVARVIDEKLLRLQPRCFSLRDTAPTLRLKCQTRDAEGRRARKLQLER